jgi:hypothetical protein
MSLLDSTAFGNIVSLIGVIVTVGGFTATIIGVYRARSAASAAEQAAGRVRDDLTKADVISDCAQAIKILELIRRDQRQGEPNLPAIIDSYEDVRGYIVRVRESEFIASKEDSERFSMLVNSCRSNVTEIEIAIKEPSRIDTIKMNDTVSAMIDSANAVLIHLRKSLRK